MKNLLNVKSVMWIVFRKFSFLLYTLPIITLHVSVVNAEWNPWHPDPLIEYHYSHDNVGNITAIEDSVKSSTSTFTYDEVNRLTSAIGQYGAGGTQQTQTYSYNAVGDIDGTPNMPTDGNGNITQIDGKVIEYGRENRPHRITDSSGTITEFGYDYSGQRVWKAVTANGETTETLYCGNIYEVQISTTGAETQTAHIYAGSLRVASRIIKNGGSNTYYYLGDHLGSTMMMTDALGEVVQDITYEPWGNTVTESSTTYKADHKFTGQMLDDSTNLYYYGARYYDPSLKRFISPDPKLLETDLEPEYLLEPKNLNCYAYCWNNPLKFVDPDGRVVVADDIVIVGLIFLGYSGTVALVNPEARETANQMARDISASARDFASWVGANTRKLMSKLGSQAASTNPEPIGEPPTGSDDKGTTSKKTVPNPYGKKGGPEHQGKIAELINKLKTEGYEIIKTEQRLATPGGVKDVRYGDIYVKSPDGQKTVIQVGRQTKNGMPVAREIKALNDLRQAGYQVEFVPYNNP